MNRNARQAAKENAERQKALDRAAALREQDHVREAGIAQAFVRPDLDPKKRIARRVERSGVTSFARDFLSIVAERAPRLLDSSYSGAVEVMAGQPRLRPTETWAPKSKGVTALYNSLASHAFAAFPMPRVLWSAFGEDHHLVALVLWIASGGSFVEYVKTRFPIPLTRKMCHLVLSSSSERSLLSTIRRSQILALGGAPQLAAQWASTQHTRTIGTRDEETFLAHVAEWLATHLVKLEDTGPLVDYVVARHRDEPSFTLKGRTAASLGEAMRRWHRELAEAKIWAQIHFRPSGLRKLELSLPQSPTQPTKVVWRVEEVLTSRELVEEGRRMNHCVASYANAVATGAISIWTMTMEDGTGPTGRWAQLTIEVRHATRSIVQARGRFNRMPTPQERSVLARWASLNALTVT